MTVVVDTQDLLEKVIENRNAHAAEIDKAREEWLPKFKKALDKAAKKGHVNVAQVERDLKVKQPVSNLHWYDEWITKLEWEDRTTLELSDYEFKQLVHGNFDLGGGYINTGSSITYNTTSNQLLVNGVLTTNKLQG